MKDSSTFHLALSLTSDASQSKRLLKKRKGKNEFVPIYLWKGNSLYHSTHFISMLKKILQQLSNEISYRCFLFLFFNRTQNSSMWLGRTGSYNHAACMGDVSPPANKNLFSKIKSFQKPKYFVDVYQKLVFLPDTIRNLYEHHQLPYGVQPQVFLAPGDCRLCLPQVLAPRSFELNKDATRKLYYTPAAPANWNYML